MQAQHTPYCTEEVVRNGYLGVPPPQHKLDFPIFKCSKVATHHHVMMADDGRNIDRRRKDFPPEDAVLPRLSRTFRLLFDVMGMAAMTKIVISATVDFGI